MIQSNGINHVLNNSELSGSFEFYYGLLWSLLLIFFIFFDLKKYYLNQVQEILYGSKLKIIGSFLSVFLISFAIIGFSWDLSNLFLAFLYALTISFSVFSPVNAVSFFVFFIIARQWEFTDGNVISSMPQDFGFLMLMSFSFHKYLNKEKKIYFEKDLLYLGGYLIFLLLGFWKTNLGFSAIPEIISLFFKISIFYIIAVDSIRNHIDLNKFKAAIVFAVLIRGVLSLVYNNYFTLPDADSYKSFILRLEGIGSLGDPNDLSSIIILSLPLIYFGLLKIKRISIRFFFLIPAVSLSFFIIWGTRSRGAILSLFVMIGVWLFMRFKHFLPSLIVMCLIGSLYFPLKSSFQRDAADLELSTANRINYWVTGVHMVTKNPILGIGYNMYPPLFEEYAPELKGEYGNRTAHSNWVLVLAETGVIGFVFYLLFFINAMKKVWKIRHVSHAELLSGVGYFCAISFLTQTYTYFPYIMACLCACSYKVYNPLIIKEEDEENNISTSMAA